MFSCKDASLLSKSAESPTDLQVMEPVVQLQVSESASIKSQSNEPCDAKTSSAENVFDSQHTPLPDNTMQSCKSPAGTENSSGPKSPIAGSPLAYERSLLSTYASPSPASPWMVAQSQQQNPQKGKYIFFFPLATTYSNTRVPLVFLFHSHYIVLPPCLSSSLFFLLRSLFLHSLHFVPFFVCRRVCLSSVPINP